MARQQNRLTFGIQQRIWLQRVVGVGLVLASTLIWYRNSPVRQDDPAERVIYVQKQPGFQVSEKVATHSSAHQELPMLRESLRSLRSLKRPSGQQHGRLSLLEQQQAKLQALEDYELRLSLHAQDTQPQAVRMREDLQQRIRTLQQALENDQDLTH